MAGVSDRLDSLLATIDGRDYEFENIAPVIAPELAYTVESERLRTRVGGSDELTPLAIRATTVFRREDGNWKLTHRHGDPITSIGSAGYWAGDVAGERRDAASSTALGFAGALPCVNAGL